MLVALGSLYKQSPERDKTNFQYRDYPRFRANLLKAVRQIWVTGILENSLPEALRIALDLDIELQLSSRRQLQQVGKQTTSLADEASIANVFAKAGRKLLILGAPGAGKTMLLLELAKALLAQAEADEQAPIPLVFNLSSWAQEQAALGDWLVEELFHIYGLSREAARDLIEKKLLVLLLDGLDEVREEARDECVDAINTFQSEHVVELVVCSRIEDYESLEQQLNIPTAVRILPLTLNQINAFVSRDNLKLKAVGATLRNDPTLHKLAQTPFFLNIMAMAYQGLEIADLEPLTTVEARRQHLFRAYVRRAFVHRPMPQDAAYTQAQAQYWLARLATGMAPISNPFSTLSAYNQLGYPLQANIGIG